MASNFETVQEIYAAFGRQDIPAILEKLAPDVSWEHGAADHGVPWLAPGTGVGHVTNFFMALAGLEFRRFDLRALADGGDTVVALIDISLKVLASGGELDDLEGHVWHFNADGKVDQFNHLVDTAKHIAALKGKTAGAA